MRYKDTEEYIFKYRKVLDYVEICFDLLFEHEMEDIVFYSPSKIKERLEYELIDDEVEATTLDIYYVNDLEKLQQRCDRLAYQYEIYNETYPHDLSEKLRLREYPEVSLRLQSLKRILNLNDERDIKLIDDELRRISSKHKKKYNPDEPAQHSSSTLEELFIAHLNLAYNVAKSKYLVLKMPFLDVRMEACIELYECVKAFDSSRGFKLNSLYRSYIYQKLQENSQKYLNHGIKATYGYYSMIKKVSKGYNFLYNVLQDSPSIGEIANILDIPTEKIGDCIKYSQLEFINIDECMTINKDILYDENDDLTPPYFNEFILDSDTVGDQELLQESLKSEVRRVIQKYLHSQRKEIV